jgi:hypothetical protein
MHRRRSKRRKNPGLKTILVLAAIVGGYYLWVASKLYPAPAKTGLPPGAKNVLPVQPGRMIPQDDFSSTIHGRE